MSQEKKQVIAKALKPLLKKYGVKGTLSVRNHSTIVLTLKSGVIDFIGNYNSTVRPAHLPFQPAKDYIQVNTYWCHEHFSGKAKAFLVEALKVMKSAGWYDRSDAQVDYFDTAYYVDINVGRWNKSYEVTK